MDTVKINPKGTKRVRFGHPWVFKSDTIAPLPKDAGIVKVQDHRGRYIADALFSPRSQITLRVVRNGYYGTLGGVDEALISNRIADALKRKCSLYKITNAIRVLFAESDLLPSVIIDRYDSHWVVQTLSAGADLLKEMIFKVIEKEYTPQAVIERNDAPVRKLEGLGEISRMVMGKDPKVEIKEGSQVFIVDTMKGQKTGAFLDQRQNRIAIKEFSAGRALDCFSYQGWFACHMAAAADHVKAVDISTAAVDFVKLNAKKNGHSNIEAVEANVFDLLHDMRDETFDLIHLDPPAFVKSRSSLSDGIRGYKEINLRAMKMLKKGGYLMTSSCSQHLSRDEFIAMLHAAGTDAGRSFQIVRQGSQDIDHPVLLSFPESEYLKTIVLRVL